MRKRCPSDLPSLPNITTIQILKHLEKYMTQEDLWRKKVNLKLFVDYLCEQYNCDTPCELGARIQSWTVDFGKLRGHLTTVFFKISVRRSKRCL